MIHRDATLSVMPLSETTQQYIERILGNVAGQDPMLVLDTTAARLRALVAGQSPEALSRKPSPDRWSVTEILAHLADAEIVGAWRFRSVLASDGVPLQAYDQNVWAEMSKYADTDPLESLQLFESARRATVALLERVDRPRLEHHGIHAERGRESVTHLVRLYAGHDINHLRQIEALLAN